MITDEMWADFADSLQGDDSTDTETQQADVAPVDFSEYLTQLAGLNGQLIDRVVTDAPSLAGLSAADKLRFYARLSELGVSNAVLEEVRGVVGKEKRRKTNKAAGGAVRVSDRIYGDLSAWGYDLWLNDMDDSVWSGDQRLTDAQRAELRMTARNASYAELKLLTALDDAIVALAAKRRRHPLKEYLSALEWDGQDHIAALAAHFTDKHSPITYPDGSQRTVFHAFVLRWLVGSVARIHGDIGAARDNKVLVLAAEQGRGKSHFAGWICALPSFFVERHINPDNKDASLMRARCWVWEIGELGATTKRADLEALKAHITATTVTERQAYGHFDTVKPCLASYVGTVNPDGAGFLTDTTGNRRFAVVDVAAIDWGYVAIDIAQVWAQAMAIWRADGRAYRFTNEENAVQAANAETHMDSDIYADILVRLYEIDAKHNGLDVTSSEILDAMRTFGGLSRTSDIAQARQLARTLKHTWGIVGRRSNGKTVYSGLSRRG